MNENHKEAAKASKTGNAMFVVYVPDEGEQVYTAEQMKIWQAFVMLEATYVCGKRVS